MSTHCSDLKDFTLTVGGKTITLVNSSKILERGKIYNINRSGAPAGKTVDLSTLTADYMAQDGDELTGTLTNSYKISIAVGATVTLNGVTISNDENYCIKCLGNATIVLADGSENTLSSLSSNYPSADLRDAEKN